MCCAVHFYRSKHYQVLHQRSLHAALIMSILWKETEFYKGESDREVIVIAARGLRKGVESLLQQTGFPIMGALFSHQTFPLHMKVLVFPIVS